MVNDPPPATIVQVTAGVIVRRHDSPITDHRLPITDQGSPTVLVCQRAADELHHPGKWEFPGGKVEPGESLSECLRRELEEELGITAEIGAALATTNHHYVGRGQVEITFFKVDRFTGTLTNRIFGEVRWVPIIDVAALDFLEADRQFVEQLARGGIEILA